MVNATLHKDEARLTKSIQIGASPRLPLEKTTAPIPQRRITQGPTRVWPLLEQCKYYSRFRNQLIPPVFTNCGAVFLSAGH